MSSQSGVIIDAALRFARSDPELVRYAQESAEKIGVPVDDLLRDAIDRVARIRSVEGEARISFPPGRTFLRAV